VISKADQENLVKLAKMRAKVSREGIAARQAAMIADVEEQLSATYEFDDAVWAEITREAKAAVDSADAKIAAICQELGVPPKFRPELQIRWYSRGENAVRERRAELRQLAEKRIEAAGQAAKLAISEREVETIGELYAARFETDEARELVERMPTPAELMPTISIGELGAEQRPTPAGGGLSRSALLRTQVANEMLATPNLSARAVARKLSISPTTAATIMGELSSKADEVSSSLDADLSEVDADGPT
jgi:hypothetical protein